MHSSSLTFNGRHQRQAKLTSMGKQSFVGREGKALPPECRAVGFVTLSTAGAGEGDFLASCCYADSFAPVGLNATERAIGLAFAHHPSTCFEPPLGETRRLMLGQLEYCLGRRQRRPRSWVCSSSSSASRMPAAMTLPHQLVRTVLLKHICRARTIRWGHRQHRL